MRPIEYKCPICSTELGYNERYPKHVCPTCAEKATSLEGRPLIFSNIGTFGGFIAKFADDGLLYPSHECLINNVRCHADEARFGGIVIEVMG